MNWKRLGAVEPSQLAETRLNLHFAAQVVSGLGRTLLPEHKDDSHTSLVWLERLGALAGQPVDGDKPLRAALDFERFRLLLLDSDENTLFESALAGKTVEQAYSWLAAGVAARLGQTFPGFKSLHYEMPEHPLADQAAFSFEPAEPFGELSRWYSNAAVVIEEVSRSHGGEPVRCWPHHFDIATLIELGSDKTIGVGMSPGDSTYNEPYWYVGPYPHPSPNEWPELPSGGRWHTDGFVAAVLTGTDWVKENDQPKRLGEFLDAAVRASKELLAE